MNAPSPKMAALAEADAAIARMVDASNRAYHAAEALLIIRAARERAQANSIRAASEARAGLAGGR